MKHSFVVPAYKAAPLVEECLASLSAQKTKSDRVLVTTSTPSEALSEIVARHNVKFEINPRSAGIGADWNFALAHAQGDLITLAHQDDMYEPEFLSQTLGAFKAYPDALLSFTDYEEFTIAGPRQSGANLRIKRFLCDHAFGRAAYIERQQDKQRLLAWGNPICCSSVTFNRRLLSDFRFVETMGSNLDWQAWLQLARREGKFIYIRQPLVRRRIHTSSETSVAIADKRRQLEDAQMFAQSWPPLIGKLIAYVYRLSYLANKV